MHVLFCHDTFYTKSRDGSVYSYGAFPYELWQKRYLKHFDSLCILGRKKKMSMEESGTLAVSSGLHVEHVLLANINRPIKRLTKSGRTYKKIFEQVKKADAVIICGPLEFGMMAAKAARATGKPYAVEMSCCAFDRSWYRGSLLGKLYAPIKYRRAQKMVRHADAVMYVTEHFLQSRYPTNGIMQYASNVEIAHAEDGVLQKRIEKIKTQNDPVIIGMIGNVVNGLKGLGVAINALGKVKKELPEDKDFTLKILGQGIPALWQQLINENDLQGKVEFCGSVPGGQDVLDWLDNIDIYIQPSFHEGLPRSLIEAMSRGCPALSSDAGGTDELLTSDYIHPRGDTEKLAEHMISMILSNDREQRARDNFRKARNYSCEILTPRREEFWDKFAQIAKEKSGIKSEPLKKVA